MKYYFVYNAKSGLFNKMSDAAHKALSPDTYDCNLCKLTYGLSSMKKEWKEFIQNYNIEFTYKDTFAGREAPAVYDEQKNILIHKDEINDCETLQDLKTLVAEKLREKEL